jgi:hypothetical protein
MSRRQEHDARDVPEEVEEEEQPEHGRWSGSCAAPDGFHAECIHR